jgi:hypothetical protein
MQDGEVTGPRAVVIPEMMVGFGPGDRLGESERLEVRSWHEGAYSGGALPPTDQGTRVCSRRWTRGKESLRRMAALLSQPA